MLASNYPTVTERLHMADLELGIIRFTDEITEYESSSFVQELEAIKRAGLQEVTVKLNSGGGGAYAAFAMYDVLRASGLKVIIEVQGMAASAASMILLQAADVRRAYRSARFLLHEVRQWAFMAEQKASDLHDQAKEMDAITNMIADILVARTHKTREEIITAIERKELWLSATEALEWGLIDEII